MQDSGYTTVSHYIYSKLYLKRKLATDETKKKKRGLLVNYLAEYFDVFREMLDA